MELMFASLINTLLFSFVFEIRITDSQKNFNVKFDDHLKQNLSILQRTATITVPKDSRIFNNKPILNNNNNNKNKNNIITTDKVKSDIKQQMENSGELLEPLPVIQSSRCTEKEIRFKLQCFRLVPSNTYEVLQNSTVTIPCIVLNQHGKVQWRAKSYLLGYDRSVPGMERIEIVGLASEGEHNLRISNIQPEDEGEYECQVQPVMEHPLLRRHTKISVLTPPSRPQMWYQNNMVDDNLVIILPLSNQTKTMYPKYIQLTCRADNGNPEPKFIWSLDSDQHHQQQYNLMSTYALPFLFQKPFSSNYPKSSTIKLITKKLASNDQIKCAAENKAVLLMRQNRQFVEKSVVVKIIFYKYPGQPQLDNKSYLKSHLFKEGGLLSARCSLSPKGYPLPEINWYWRVSYENDIDMYASGSGSDKQIKSIKPKTEFIKSEPMAESIIEDEVSSHLVNIRLSRYYHAAELVCSVSHILRQQVLEDSVIISVEFPPSRLSIMPTNISSLSDLSNSFWLKQPLPSTQHLVSLIDGQLYQFLCATTAHNSNTRLNWNYLGYNQHSSNNNNSLQQPELQNMIGRSTQLTRTVNSHFKQTLSLIQLKAAKVLLHYDLQCSAFIVDQIAVSSKIKISVFYAPPAPSLSNLTDPINEHDLVNLVCTSQGGRPLPDLYWYRDNQTLSNAEPTSSNGNSISSLLSFKVSRRDNGKKINCAARNVATGSRGIYSLPVAITVLFPARRVKITSHTPILKTLREGTFILMTCTTSSSNPASVVKWWLIRCHSVQRQQSKMGRNVTDNKNVDQCMNTQLKEYHVLHIMGDNGGKHTISKLRYQIKWMDHLNFIECQSELPVSKPNSFSSIQYDRIRLSVIHKPYFIAFIASSTINNNNNNNHIVSYFQKFSNIPFPEFSTLRIQVRFQGNPPVRKYVWFRGVNMVTDLTPSDVQINQSVLTIQNASRMYMDYYTVIAFNKLGNMSVGFFLNITYPPQITAGGTETNTAVNQVKIQNNSSVTTTFCNFFANPSSVSFVRWEVLQPIDILSSIEDEDQWVVLTVVYCNESKQVDNAATWWTDKFWVTVNCTDVVVGGTELLQNIPKLSNNNNKNYNEQNKGNNNNNIITTMWKQIQHQTQQQLLLQKKKVEKQQQQLLYDKAKWEFSTLSSYKMYNYTSGKYNNNDNNNNNTNSNTEAIVRCIFEASRDNYEYSNNNNNNNNNINQENKRPKSDSGNYEPVPSSPKPAASIAQRRFHFYSESKPQFIPLNQFGQTGVVLQPPENRKFYFEARCVFRAHPLNYTNWYPCLSSSSARNNINDSIKYKNGNFTDTLSSVFQYISISRQLYSVQPNLFIAVLRLYLPTWPLSVKKNSKWKICCKASNSYGSDVGTVMLCNESMPEKPTDVKVFQIQSNFVVISWIQGFDGGHKQTFNIKVLRKDSNDEIFETEAVGSRENNRIYKNISNLRDDTCYRLLVGSFNILSNIINYADVLKICTPKAIKKDNQLGQKQETGLLNVNSKKRKSSSTINNNNSNSSNSNNDSSSSANSGSSSSSKKPPLNNKKTTQDHLFEKRDKKDKGKKEKIASFIITVAGCVFGFVIVVINLLLFLICYKKRQEENCRNHKKVQQQKRCQFNKNGTDTDAVDVGVSSCQRIMDSGHTDNQSFSGQSKLEISVLDTNSGYYPVASEAVTFIGGFETSYPSTDRGKEEEIPMLMYSKSVCPLHLTPTENFSNPLIIQDHYFQPDYNCNQKYSSTGINFPSGPNDTIARYSTKLPMNVNYSNQQQDLKLNENDILISTTSGVQPTNQIGVSLNPDSITGTYTLNNIPISNYFQDYITTSDLNYQQYQSNVHDAGLKFNLIQTSDPSESIIMHSQIRDAKSDHNCVNSELQSDPTLQSSIR